MVVNPKPHELLTFPASEMWLDADIPQSDAPLPKLSPFQYLSLQL